MFAPIGRKIRVELNEVEIGDNGDRGGAKGLGFWRGGIYGGVAEKDLTLRRKEWGSKAAGDREQEVFGCEDRA